MKSLLPLRLLGPTQLLTASAVYVLLAAAASFAAEPFAFAALGCMPYSNTPDSRGSFGRLIGEINRHTPVFTVHLGDILGGAEHCTDELLVERRADFNTFTSALVYTPGDNEWTDTWQERGGSFVATERLARIRALFFAEERSLGRQPLPLTTQRRDPRFARFVENARWRHGGVIFATVHVVGSRNNYQPDVPTALEEWRERDEANVAWIRASFAEARTLQSPGIALFFQANPFAADKEKSGYDLGFENILKAIEAESRAFAKPVLLVHADEHRYRLDVGMRFEAEGVPAPNVTRLETFGAANVHAVFVTVDPGSPQVFLAAPLIVPGNPLPILPRAKAKK